MSGRTGGSAAPARLLDAVLAQPALVVGGLPPQARDLDVVLAPESVAPAEEALRAQGFARGAAGSWRRTATGGGPDDEAELLAAADAGIPPGELDRLLAEARPVPGYGRLVRPSAAGTLLLLAGVRDGRRPGPGVRYRLVREQQRREALQERAPRVRAAVRAVRAR